MDGQKQEVTREQYIIQNLQTQIGGMATTIADLRFTCEAMQQKIKELEEKVGDSNDIQQ